MGLRSGLCEGQSAAAIKAGILFPSHCCVVFDLWAGAECCLKNQCSFLNKVAFKGSTAFPKTFS